MSNVTQQIKSPKELLKEAYRAQAEHFSKAYIDQVCLNLAELANGKQMLEIQEVLNEKVNLEPFMEILADFIITEAKLTDDEIMVVVNYTTSEVGQRTIKASLNSAKFLQENTGAILSSSIFKEILPVIESIIEKE